MSIVDEPEVRMIDNPGVPERYARGWHCLGLAKEFSDGKPHTMHAFGQKLVIWADTKGDIQVLDAYCRHMGGDLSQGEVKGDEVACPFHDWRWNGEGKCTSIPYSRRVPLRARTATWPTMVNDGILFVWNDPEGNPPIEDQMIPDIPMVGDPEWTDWHWYKFKIEGSNCREIIDNVVDMAHFFYVHGSLPTYFKNVFEGHVATQYMNGQGRPDLETNRGMDSVRKGMESVGTYYGPSFMLNPMVTHFDGFSINSMLINCHYPIDQNNFMLNYAIMVKKTDFPEPVAPAISRCGICARSQTTASPAMFLPRAKASGDLCFWNSSVASSSLSVTVLGFLLGTSTPTADC